MKYLLYCPECGEEIEKGASFCPNCGKSLEETTTKLTKSDSKIKKNIKAEDFLQRPELIMLIGGFLPILGAIGSWYSISYFGRTVTVGWVARGMRFSTAWMGLILIYSSLVELGYIDLLKQFVPVLNVTSICGSVTIIGALGSLTASTSAGWGLILALMGVAVTLFAAFRAYEKN